MSKHNHKTGHKSGHKNDRKREHQDKGQSFGKPRDLDETVKLYGYHACEAALRNANRRIIQASITRNLADRLIAEAVALPEGWREVRPRDLDQLVERDAVHQGIVLEAERLSQPTLEDVRHHDLVVVLDQVTDPHNVGAIIRSACALGAGAVVTTLRNAPHENGLLAKTASGAFEHVPYIQVTNLARAVEEIRALQFSAIGLDSEGPSDLIKSLADHGGEKIALILGAEGRGLRRLTRDLCDALARLDMPGPIKSLNVSNAAALSLFVCRQSLDAQAGSAD
uniref:TrmH family RNA methyltransferase n=1 Tax=Pararhizobium sp. IMCC3301 TaxID=3067904 RepID=UPI002741DC77|nr:RNA methyltransferase [Pararhizobium sp. IMCC3301]